MTTDQGAYTGFPPTDDAERERMVGLIHPWTERRAQMGKDRKNDKTDTDLLKAFLETDAEDELWDGERGEGVRLTETAGRRWVEFDGMDDETIVQAARLGCLQLKTDMLDALADVPNREIQDFLSQFKPRVHQGGGTRLTAVTEGER